MTSFAFASSSAIHAAAVTAVASSDAVVLLRATPELAHSRMVICGPIAWQAVPFAAKVSNKLAPAAVAAKAGAEDKLEHGELEGGAGVGDESCDPS